MIKYLKLPILLIVLTAMVCCNSKPEQSQTGAPKTNYSIGVRSEGVSYLIATDNLSKGTISVKNNGTQVDATGMITSGRYMYFFSRVEKKFYQYELRTDGTTTQKAVLDVADYIADQAYSQNLIGDSTILIMDPVKWGEAEIKWLIISIPDFKISASGSFKLPSKEKSPGVNWKSNVGKTVLHAGKLIMGTVYYDFEGNFAPGAHAVVFEYPSMTNPQLICTNLITAELGVYTSNGFVTSENGDLYVAAVRGALWGAITDSQVFGTILRIKKGETSFDEGYLLDLSKAIGEPTNIMQLDDIGGKSAMALLVDDTKVKGWKDINNDHYFFAKLDLESKTVTKYKIPNSDARTARRPLIDQGKYITFLKSKKAQTTHLLEIDLNKGPNAFTKGALIEGKDVMGYSVTRHPER